MLFVSLLHPKGRGAEAIKYLKSIKTKERITLKGVYFTYGRYDGIIMFEAPDEATAMKFIMETGFSTMYTVETLVAVSAEKL